jgi:alpha-beta hydrolase superfamily lysophospholipase
VNSLLKKVSRALLKTILAVGALIILVLLGLGARAALTLPPLQAWHESGPWTEAFDYAGYNSFAPYQADEQRFIAGVFQALSQEGGTLSKYTPGSPYAPGSAQGLNENGSFAMRPENQALTGGILLVHGLSDSPYHMKALAELFRSRGCYVLSLRLPGHGTAPGALVDVTREQWRAAVDFGVRMVLQEIEAVENAKFYLGGFSTGGALLLSYTFDALATNTMRVPDHLFLFSPAVGITRRAALADWHELADWLPYYEKLRWDTVAPEEDPYKYSSFPKNAADQIFELTLLNKIKAHRVSNDIARRAAMPPILAFQSMVDGTVVATDLVALFQQVGTRESELVLFDINRVHAVRIDPLKAKALPTDDLNDPAFQSNLIIATNRSDGGAADSVAFYRARRPNPAESFSLTRMVDLPSAPWPRQTFALSHVSIPIAPEDPVYGQASRLPAGKPGTWVGEINTLTNSETLLERIRYNPFYPAVRARIETTLAASTERNEHPSLNTKGGLEWK